MARRTKIILFAVIALSSFSISVDQCESGEESDRNRIVNRIVEYLKGEKVATSETRLRMIARHVYRESNRYNIDYRLILALMKVESSFRHNAVSRKGAMGLLQIKPSLGESVARDIGIAWRGPSQLHDPDKNIRIGVHHLSQLIDMFGTLPCALHAYNKGSARAKGEAARRQAPNARFTAAVMKEYSKTLTILPHPDDHND